MSTLIAITYEDEASGRGAFEALEHLQKMQVLKLEDAALATKDAKGKVKVKQTFIEATTDKVLPELEKFGGTVYQTSLSNEDEEKLKKALEHEQVSASADEMLELE